MIKRNIDLVSGAAKKPPEATAVVANGSRLTFAELDAHIGRLRSAFRNACLKKSWQVCLLQIGNGITLFSDGSPDIFIDLQIYLAVNTIRPFGHPSQAIARH